MKSVQVVQPSLLQGRCGCVTCWRWSLHAGGAGQGARSARPSGTSCGWIVTEAAAGAHDIARPHVFSPCSSSVGARLWSLSVQGESSGMAASLVETLTEEDEFQDADDAVGFISEPRAGRMTLERSLEECGISVGYFFNNRFEAARELMRPWRDSSVYHAMGYGMMTYLRAVMTFEPRDIAEAVTVLRESLDVCNRARRVTSLPESVSRMMGKADYRTYTELECHAELCYAECLLLRAVLNILQDESFLSLIKSGLKIKTCFNSYRECCHMLNSRDWSFSKTRHHFEGGVRLGVGTFSLLISQLPPKIMKILEFVGFSGSKDVGLEDLQTTFELDGNIHRSMASLVLLGYHLLVNSVLGSGDCDLQLAESILEQELQVYPDSVFFVFFHGRLEMVHGRLERAVQLYTRSWRSQHCWPQFHQICYWELYWCHVFLSDWSAAADQAERLLRESRWSRTVYSYLRAAALLMMQRRQHTTARQLEVHQLMCQLPSFKQRIAGKSLSMEKMVIAKACRYQAQDCRLLVPGYELLYLWNGFNVLKKRRDLIEEVYSDLEAEMKILDSKGESASVEDLALLLLLHGVCLSHLNSPLLAEESLQRVTRLQSQLPANCYLVPFAWLELGLLAAADARTDDAIRMLEHAKNGYKRFSLENRLHFRVHFALNALNSANSADSNQLL